MADAFKETLDVVYAAAGDRKALNAVYDDWALHYDQDLWASGNPQILIIAAFCTRYLPDTGVRILDGGCGTGRLGEALAMLGYDDIVGLDGSPGMLAVARGKRRYRELYELLLGATIDLPDESFDAVTASGVLTHGHAPPDSLDGLLKVARPGAPIIFSLSEPAWRQGFGDKVEALTSAGAWHLLEQTAPFRAYPFLDDYADLMNWVCVYRKAA